MYKTAALLASVGAASAAEFVAQDGTTATMVLGVGVSSSTYTVAGAGQNGVGGEIETFNGEKWVKDFLPVGTLMDAAASDKVSVGVSMWQVELSTDSGATFTTLESVHGLSQSCSVFGDGTSIGLVGSFVVDGASSAVSGVTFSTDAGASWTSSEVPVGMVRYGSFPTADTWYVTSGMWGDSVSAKEGSAHFSSRISVNSKGSISINDNNLKVKGNTTEASGWWGAISKTSDAGKTWETVFQSQPEDVYYFNGISCSSDTHCVAVAEGDSYLAYVTFDGGATWSNNFNDVPDTLVSMMGAAWEDDSNGWIAGVTKDGRTLNGNFFKTTDGGKTFALEQALTDCYPIDMDFKGSTGAAACLNSAGSSGYVAMYMA